MVCQSSTKRGSDMLLGVWGTFGGTNPFEYVWLTTTLENADICDWHELGAALETVLLCDSLFCNSPFLLQLFLYSCVLFFLRRTLASRQFCDCNCLQDTVPRSIFPVRTYVGTNVQLLTVLLQRDCDHKNWQSTLLTCEKMFKSFEASKEEKVD